jgi:hypothetical protein
MLEMPAETPASPPNSVGISDAAWEGKHTVASDSKIFRDKAARVLREARKAQLESQRTILIEISATHKRLALDEERLRGEPLRSRKRRTDRAANARSGFGALASLRRLESDSTGTPPLQEHATGSPSALGVERGKAA